MPSLQTYFHTIRHLRAVQLYGRLWFRINRPRLTSAPAFQLRSPSGKWTPTARARPSLIGPARFRFLNEIHDLAQIGWDDPVIAKLWRYNLHYFDDLNAVDATSRTAWHINLLQQWVRENPVGRGTGWEPYPVSRRIVNWIKWVMQGNELPLQCLSSLALQAEWLQRRLEYHLLGNHLLANAKALVFAGSFFDGVAAQRWLKTGTRILEREVSEQILPDGGHFERSPMYHALTLEDLLDVCNVLRVYPAESNASNAPSRRWEAVLPAMQTWLDAMTHPDGEISFFNDAAIGVAPAPQELIAYAAALDVGGGQALERPVETLAQSGYIRVTEPDAVTIVDVAPIGPDYLPAHAHADTLSFELSLFGQRVFVNTGTSQYMAGAARSYERSTAAHNTVTVGGADSSEVWNAFRVGRRARPRDLVIENDSPHIMCAHDGYDRFGTRHGREWCYDEHGMRIIDRLTGSTCTGEARFHVHPEIKLETVGVDELRMQLPAGQNVRFSTDGGRIVLEADVWHPEFGVSRESHCIVVAFTGTLITRVAWR